MSWELAFQAVAPTIVGLFCSHDSSRKTSGQFHNLFKSEGLASSVVKYSLGLWRLLGLMQDSFMHKLRFEVGLQSSAVESIHHLIRRRVQHRASGEGPLTTGFVGEILQQIAECLKHGVNQAVCKSLQMSIPIEVE